MLVNNEVDRASKETAWPTRDSETEESHENYFRLAEFEVTAVRIQVWNTAVIPAVQRVSNGDNDNGGDEDENKIPTWMFS